MDAIYYCGGHQGSFYFHVGKSIVNPRKLSDIIVCNPKGEKLELKDLSDDQLRLIGNTIAVYLAEKEGGINFDDQK